MRISLSSKAFHKNFIESTTLKAPSENVGHSEIGSKSKREELDDEVASTSSGAMERFRLYINESGDSKIYLEHIVVSSLSKTLLCCCHLSSSYRVFAAFEVWPKFLPCSKRALLNKIAFSI